MDKDLDRLLDTYSAAGADEVLLQRVFAAIELAESLPSAYIAADQIQVKDPARSWFAYAALLFLSGLFGFGLGAGQARDKNHNITVSASVGSREDSGMVSDTPKQVQYNKGYADRIILGPNSPDEIML